MERVHTFLVLLLGVVSCSQDQSSGSVLEVPVRPGDNITLYCRCKFSKGVYIGWYRICSHENQPTLAIRPERDYVKGTMVAGPVKSFHRFHFVRNVSSQSFDLLIVNITNSDVGLYYCGIEMGRTEYKECFNQTGYGYGSTRITVDSSEPHHSETPQECSSCWTLLFYLCPTFGVLSSLLSSLLVYRLCHKTAKEHQVDEQTPDTRGQTRLNEGEDVCYAALEIRQASQRPKKKKTHSSDFSTYSAINTSRM